MSSSPAPMANGYVAGASALDPADAALIARRDRAMGPAYRLFYDEPLHIVEASDVWLTAADGRRYLDAYNNVASVGHAHPRVVTAIAEQAARLASHTRYLSEPVVAFAERLLATMPAGLRAGEAHAMFTCTGSEANDLALRMARHVTGAEGVLVTRHAYHGVTAAVAECSPSLGEAVVGARVRRFDPPGADLDAFAAGIEAAIGDLARAGMRPAALLVDTILSSDGVISGPPGWLAEAARVARAHGALLIADEVQAGFGRTGAGWWGFDRLGVVPDIVTMGKPMGNGYPVAAVVARADLVARFGGDVRYFNTFGGNQVAVAAAGAVMDVIEELRLIGNAADRGAELASGLRALGSSSGVRKLGEVRQTGLFLGVDVLDNEGRPDATRARHVVNAMRRAGVLVSATGLDASTLKIRPPLTLDPGHVETIVAAASDAIGLEQLRS